MTVHSDWTAALNVQRFILMDRLALYGGVSITSDGCGPLGE
jgi:hypothetical protein